MIENLMHHTDRKKDTMKDIIFYFYVQSTCTEAIVVSYSSLDD